MLRPIIRVATNHEGDRVRELLQDNDSVVADVILDWSNLNGNWLVALDGNIIVGCLQVCPGKPIGTIDHLGLAAELNSIQRGIITKGITDVGAATLRLFGTQVAISFIPNELVRYIRVAEKRRWHVISEGKSVLKRLL